MAPDGTPFIVLGPPRSRTYWLSRYLSYGRYHCAHEQTRHLRSLADIRAWLSQDWTGCAETSAAPWWRLIEQYRSGVRVLVVRRPVEEVVNSLMTLDMQDVCTFDRAALTRLACGLDAKLNQIERRMPNVLSVRFGDLQSEATCARVFEHCLSYPHDHNWWGMHAPVNLQVSMPALMRYVFAHKEQLRKLTQIARHQTIAGMARKIPRDMDDMVIAEESIDVWATEGADMCKDHAVSVGEEPDYRKQINVPMIRELEKRGAAQTMIARCNGKMFGYLISIITPAMDSVDGRSAVHTGFYASKEFPRLGMKLQLAANDRIWQRGVREIIMRVGVRGDGPRLGVLYRRLGAEPCGELHRLGREAV